MSRHRSRKLPLWSVLKAAVMAGLLLVPVGYLHAQSADTLGTKLTVSGDTLNFRWDPKHPWAQLMSSGGVELFADYATERQGRVVQKLAAARPVSAADPSVMLRLPETLQAVPQGNVCLYLQVGGGRRIPLRKARSGVPDTEHFDVPGWQASVVESSTARLHQAALQELTNAVTASTTAVQASETALKNKGWTDAAACSAVQAPEFVARTKPADVLPSQLHEQEARHVCIRRSLFLREALEGDAKPDQPGNLIYALPAPTTDANLIRWLHAQRGVDADDLRERESQFNQYRDDWQRWQAQVREELRRGVVPTLGGNSDELFVQDVTAEVGREILSYAAPTSPALALSQHPAVQDVLGYLGGGMEVYNRCVHDAQDELAAKLKAWNEQVSRAPELERIAGEQLRNQCTNAITELNHQRQQLTLLHGKLDVERQREASTKSPSSRPLPSSGQPTVLNQVACSVQ